MGELTSDAGAAVAFLKRAKRVLITSHSSPDGDAIGSELGMLELVERLGGTASIVNRDPHPASLAFLPGLDRITVAEQLPAGFASDFDLAVVLECPGLDRTGLDGLDGLPILNVDHHLANERYGVLDFVDEEAPAVGEMVLAMADAAGVPASPAMADLPLHRPGHRHRRLPLLQRDAAGVRRRGAPRRRRCRPARHRRGAPRARP